MPFFLALTLNRFHNENDFNIIFVTSLCVLTASAQIKMSNRIKIAHTTSDFPIEKLDDKAWDAASEVTIDTYWSGVSAPTERQFTARLLWSETAFYVKFETNQGEPLVVSEKPDITAKTNGLWDRDVCEIFIAPDKNKRNKYFEFEIAPTGEWIDLGIEITRKKRLTDLDYNSGMTTAVRIENEKVVMAIKIEWKAFWKTPRSKDIWLGNIFRCVGKDPTRGYLTWQATKTKQPSFHVPSKFGEFEFVK